VSTSNFEEKIDMRDAFFEAVSYAAKSNPNIYVLTADHSAFLLTELAKELPSRIINIGIAEQNMVGVAAGLALTGKTVFIYGISPFVSIRVLEQLTIDVAAMNLPVIVISVGAGFTYSTDGPTHHGLQDVGAVETIPGMTILNSSDPINTAQFVQMAVRSQKPHYIRIEKEKLPILRRISKSDTDFASGYSLLRKGTDNILFVTTGQLTHSVLLAAEMLQEQNGISVSVIDVFRLKNFPSNDLADIFRQFELCISVSEIYEGFFEKHLASIIGINELTTKFANFGVPETFYFSGNDRTEILKAVRLDPDSIVDRTLGRLQHFWPEKYF